MIKYHPPYDNAQITWFGTFQVGSHLPTLQIVVDLHQYPFAPESLSPLQFSCLPLPFVRSANLVAEDPLFGSSQVSGLKNISLIKAGLRTFNQSIISLTIHSTVQGYLKREECWMRHCIKIKIHLLDVDAWVNAKLQWWRFSYVWIWSLSDILNRSTLESSLWMEPSLRCWFINGTRNQPVAWLTCKYDGNCCYWGWMISRVRKSNTNTYYCMDIVLAIQNRVDSMTLVQKAWKKFSAVQIGSIPMSASHS